MSWSWDDLGVSGSADPEKFSKDASGWVPPVYQQQAFRHRLSPSGLRRLLVLVTVLLVITILLSWPIWLRKSPAAKADKTQEWLEQTFQIQLVSSQQNENREEDRFLYWLKDDPNVRFQAIWSEDGAFETNYTNVRLFWEMRAFSEEWADYPLWFDQEMTDQMGEGAQGGSPPILFLFQIPLEGAEEFLGALSDRLEELSHTDWYVRQPPEYLVALAHGEAILCSYHSVDRGMPSRSELLSYYQTSLCGPLLEDLLFQQDVVLWDYPSDEDLIWANTGEGSVLDQNGWWISCRGIGREGTDLTMYYFLREDYSALYCIPSAVIDNMDEGFVLSCAETRTMSCGHTIEIYRIL